MKDLHVYVNSVLYELDVSNANIIVFDPSDIVYDNRMANGILHDNVRTYGYPWGCITKLLTDYAIRIFFHEKKLSLHTPLSKITDFTNCNSFIQQNFSVFDCIYHRAHIPLKEMYAYSIGQNKSPYADIYDHLHNVNMSYNFRMGSDYNNINYVLLGSIFESISGDTCIDFFHSHIFSKLNMRNTDFIMNFTSSNYQPETYFDQYLNAKKWSAGMSPAIGVLGSLEDKIKFGRFFLRNSTRSILNQKVVCMTYNGRSENLFGYSGAWNFKEVEGGVSMHYHYGFFPGYTCVLCIIPKLVLGFIIEVDNHYSSIPEMLLHSMVDNFRGIDSFEINLKKYKKIDRFIAAHKSIELEKNANTASITTDKIVDGKFFNKYIRECSIYKSSDLNVIDIAGNIYELTNKGDRLIFILKEFSKQFYIVEHPSGGILLRSLNGDEEYEFIKCI